MVRFFYLELYFDSRGDRNIIFKVFKLRKRGIWIIKLVRAKIYKIRYYFSLRDRREKENSDGNRIEWKIKIIVNARA